MRGVWVGIVILSGLLLSGCDFYVVRAIGIGPEELSRAEEAGAVFRNDFDVASQVIASFASSEGFGEIASERGPLRRVYQRSVEHAVFRLTLTGYPQRYGTTVALFEMQKRKPSETFDKMYTTLCERLKVELGEHVKGCRGGS